MPGIFISYRREDSAGYTGRLFDILSAEFGRENTYIDLDTIEGGDDFASIIDQKISISDVLVAVIGDRWLTVEGRDGARRLDDPRDFVRLEIAKALQLRIRVIPVLVAGAVMPRADDLPGELRALSGRQAVELRDSHFHQDVQQLMQSLHGALHGTGFRSEKFVKRFVPALLIGVAVLAGSGILLFQGHRPGKPSISIPQPANPSPAATAPPVDARQAHTDFATGAPRPLASIAGRWTATVKYDWGDSYRELFDFEADGPELSGTAGLLGTGRTIQEGKISGSRVSFLTRTLTTVGADQYEDTHSYKGTVAGDTIRFTLVTDSRVSEHAPVHFIATRAQGQ